MISLSDFQPLSVVKLTLFHQQPGFYRKIFQWQSLYAILIEQVPAQTTLRDCATFRRHSTGGPDVEYDYLMFTLRCVDVSGFLEVVYV